ncbi:MAG TPA: acyltransferase [Caulobacteraceae bacterium]|nr:acyltransferase [Caulobacteraceae bacterium]
MQLQRNATIDAFRGVAIIAVIAFHYFVRWEPPYNDGRHPVGLDWRYPYILALGAYGVQLFFVISGLVIAMTLTKSADVWQFAVNRFARLFPAFLVAVTLTFLVTSVYDPLGFRVTGLDYLKNLTMLAQVLRGRFVDGAYWSLEVEVLFYGFAALSWWTLRERFWVGLIGLAALGTIAGAFSSTLGHVLIAPYWPFFLFGVALWLWVFERRNVAAFPAAAALVLYLIGQERWLIDGLPAWAPQIAILGAIGCLAAFLVGGREVAWGPLPVIGRFSYSLYLLHQVLGATALTTLKSAGAPDWLALTVVVSCALSLAWIFYHFIEVPAGRWIRRQDQPWFRLPVRTRAPAE